MADLSKLKRRNTLGDPPPVEEASQNLEAPEIAADGSRSRPRCRMKNIAALMAAA